MPKYKIKKIKIIEPSKDSENFSEFVKEECYPPHPRGVFGGLLFLLVGITFLMNNMGIIPWSFWASLWQFWPVILIIIGFRILFGSGIFSRFIVTLITIFLLLFVWTKVLIIIGSPLVYQLGLDQLPWFNFLTNLTINK
jgi:hypothetical protein